MKKIILLFCTLFLLASCEKEQSTPEPAANQKSVTNDYFGTWRYQIDDGFGTWIPITITDCRKGDVCVAFPFTNAIVTGHMQSHKLIIDHQWLQPSADSSGAAVQGVLQLINDTLYVDVAVNGWYTTWTDSYELRVACIR